MKFKFENFAKAGNGTVQINNLTVICGPNNTSKTYLNYAIYSVLKDFAGLFEFDLSEEIITKLISDLKSNDSAQADLKVALFPLFNFKSVAKKIIGSKIHKYFQLPEANFLDSEISVQLSELDLEKTVVLNDYSADKLLHYNYRYENGISELNLIVNENNGNDHLSSRIEDFSYMKSLVHSILFEAHLSQIIPTPFAVTSERTGIALFYQSFDTTNSEVKDDSLHNEKKIDAKDVYSLHAMPIADNIMNLRNIDSYMNKTSFITDDRSKYTGILDSLSDLLGYGTFNVDEGSIFYQPSGKLRDKEPEIPLYATSSSVKSMFLLDLLIKNLIQKNSILVIDEPELNLHIDNQIKVARLLAELSNNDVKILVSTHSDYFVREINNLILVHNADEKQKVELMKKYGIGEFALLDNENVSAYRSTEGGEILELKTNKTGIDPANWNDLIYQENFKSENIFYESGIDQ